MAEGNCKEAGVAMVWLSRSGSFYRSAPGHLFARTGIIFRLAQSQDAVPFLTGDFMILAQFIFSLIPLLYVGSDHLGTHALQIQRRDSQLVLDQLTGDIKSVFQHYVPAVDSESTIVVPLQVTGSSSNPELRMSVRKCKFGFCKTVDLTALISLRESSQGNCDRFYTLTADLTRSSQILTDVYDSLNVGICYARASDGSGSLAMSASARHASTYSRGTIQRQIFEMLQLQIEPITRALEISLGNG